MKQRNVGYVVLTNNAIRSIDTNITPFKNKPSNCKIDVESLASAKKKLKLDLKMGYNSNIYKIILEEKFNKKSHELYFVWAEMLKRCSIKNNPSYKNYGGRGITVCERWKDFYCFIEDMGERPKGMSLDRIDNDSGYYKENCRWATREEQNNNKRTKHHCKKGHPWTIETTLWIKDKNKERRRCKICLNKYLKDRAKSK